MCTKRFKASIKILNEDAKSADVGICSDISCKDSIPLGKSFYSNKKRRP